MSQENVELAYRVYDALNRRDLQEFLAFIDPDVEFVSGMSVIEGSPTRRGHDGVQEWMEELFSIYPDWRIEVLDLRDLGDDRLIATLHGRGHGAGSGAPVDQVFWQVTELRERKVVWWRVYLSESDALEAAGLKE